MKKYFIIICLLFLTVSNIFAKDNPAFFGRWKTDSFQLEITKKYITYTDIQSKKYTKWSYTYTDFSDNGYLSNFIVEKNTIEDNSTVLDECIYSSISNQDTITWIIAGSKLYFSTYYYNIPLEEDTSLTTGEKLLILGAAAAITTYEVDTHLFSKNELESITEAAVDDVLGY